MKYMLFIIIISLIGCQDGKKIEHEPLRVKSVLKVDSLYLFEEETSLEFAIREAIAPYVDSLENWNVGDSLPKFLYDSGFDYRDTFILTLGTFGSTSYFSKRIAIFQKVSNQDVLNEICTSPFFNGTFETHRDDRQRYRFDYISNHDLAKIRLLDLANDGRDSINKLQSSDWGNVQ